MVRTKWIGQGLRCSSSARIHVDLRICPIVIGSNKQLADDDDRRSLHTLH